MKSRSKRRSVSLFSHYLKAIMQDVTLSGLEALEYRMALKGASSTNGLVSVKLRRIKRALDHELAPLLEEFDAIQQRHAKKDGDTPIALPGRFYTRTGTPAYEAIPENAAALAAELAPLYAAEITVKVPKLTAADAGWVTSQDDVGAALDPFTESDLAA